MASIANFDNKIKLQWKINWPLILMAMLFFPLLIKLGFWQLDRAEEKRQLNHQYQSLLELPPRNIDTTRLNPRYLPVKLSGRFLPNYYWFVDHKIYQGKNGYQIVMGFQLLSGEVVFVNRGWLPASPYRSELPKYNTPEDKVVILAKVSQLSDNVLIDSSKTKKVEEKRFGELSWPIIHSEFLDPELKILPIYLEIESNQAGSLIVNFPPINISSQKHIGYAVQWFSMSLALLILLLFSQSNLTDVLFSKKINEQKCSIDSSENYNA